DWASPVILANGVPSNLSNDTVDIETPKRIEKITNPLRSYTLLQDLGTLFLAGDSSNPTKRPYVPDANTPFTPKGYSIVRHPTSNYTSDKSDTSLSVVTDCSTVFRPSIAQTFQYVVNWNQFSNHGDSQFKFADGKTPFNENFGYYTSIEVVHDSVHSSLGGKDGHMGKSDIAAFDPIFFLYHCNVDRLTTIWQAINPNAWIENGDKATFTEGTFTKQPHKKLTGSTSLTPFRKSETEFWTSNGIKYIEDLGYTYPELQDYKDPNELKKYVIDLYHPNIAPYELHIFIDKPDTDAKTPKNSPNFAGLISCFARGKETQCANCIAYPDAVVHGCVDLTICMQILNINLNSITLKKLDFTSSSLKPDQIKFVACKNNNEPIKLENILIRADLYVFDKGPDHNHNYEE
ncbi:13819_t:CDS:2, partial [Gigaspora margarita]